MEPQFRCCSVQMNGLGPFCFAHVSGLRPPTAYRHLGKLQSLSTLVVSFWARTAFIKVHAC